MDPRFQGDAMPARKRTTLGCVVGMGLGDAREIRFGLTYTGFEPQDRYRDSRLTTDFFDYRVGIARSIASDVGGGGGTSSHGELTSLHCGAVPGRRIGRFSWYSGAHLTLNEPFNADRLCWDEGCKKFTRTRTLDFTLGLGLDPLMAAIGISTIHSRTDKFAAAGISLGLSVDAVPE